MNNNEEISASDLIDLGEDFDIMIKNKLIGRSNVKFLVVLIDDVTGITYSKGNLCTVCAKDILDVEIKNFKIKHSE